MTAEEEKLVEGFRKAFAFLANLSDDQIYSLATGRTRLTLAPAQKRKTPIRENKVGFSDAGRILEQLSEKSTREEGLTLLDGLSLTRESLRHVAEAMDLPVPKTDTVARLKDRIIDATIGYRLRSDAIRAPEAKHEEMYSDRHGRGVGRLTGQRKDEVEEDRGVVEPPEKVERRMHQKDGEIETTNEVKSDEVSHKSSVADFEKVNDFGDPNE